MQTVSRFRRCSTDVRRGVTLVEVIVVISVLTLLFALILPAVQASRSASQRIRCANQMRQLVFALTSYHDANRMLPSTANWTAGNDCPERWTVVSRLFPYLEINNLCDLIQADVKTLPSLICPAESEGREISGLLSYVVNTSPGYGSGSLANPPFEDLRPVRMSDITDGLSNTAAFSEDMTMRAGGSPTAASTSPLRYDWSVVLEPISEDAILHSQWAAALAERAAQTDLSIKDCNEGPRTFEPSPHANIRKWRDGLFATGTATYSHWLPPNSASCFPMGAPPMDANIFLRHSQRCASSHSGGVNVAFFDGRVQFISDQIERKPWRAFGTRDGNEAQGDVP